MADSNLKIGLGVEGVDSLKAGLSQAKYAVKQLGAELKLAQSQYKMTGDSQQYLSTQSVLLKKQLEEQAKIITNTEKLLADMKVKGDENTATYQNMQVTLTNYKRALTDTQYKLNNLGKDMDGASSSGKQLNETLDGTKKVVEDLDKKASLSTLKEGINGVTGAASTAFNAVRGLAQGIWNMELGAAQYADDTMTLWTNYQDSGLTLEDIQRMQKVNDLADTETETLLKAMDRMQKSTTEEQLKKLGLDTTKSWSEQMFDAIDVISQITDATQREELAMELFGQSFRDLGGITQNGSAWYKELLDSVNVTSEEDMNKLVSFSDAIAEMNNSIDLFKTDLAAKIADPMGKIADSFTNLMGRLDEWVSSEEGQAALEGLGESIANIFDNITSTDFDKLLNGAVAVLDGLATSFEWISENWTGVKIGIEAIAGAFALFKVTKGITAVSQLVTGLSSLNGASIAGGLGSLGKALGTVGLTVGSVYLTAKQVKLTKDLTENYGDVGGTREALRNSWLPSWTYEWLINEETGLFSNKNLDKQIENVLSGNVDAPLADLLINNPRESVLAASDRLTDEEQAALNAKGNGKPSAVIIYDLKGNPITQPILEDAWTVNNDGFLVPNADSTFGMAGTGAWDDSADFWNEKNNWGWPAEFITDSITDGIEDQEPVLNAVGSAMVAAVYAGAVSAMQGLNFGAMGGGGSPISNLYINQMNMNNGTDAEGLASLVQKELFMARRGFGG